MMTQSVMTQTAKLFGNATTSVTSKGKQTGNSFEQMFIGSTEKPDVKKSTADNSDQASKNKSDVVNGSDKQTHEATKSTATKETRPTTETNNQIQGTEDSKVSKEVTGEAKEDITTEEETLEKIAGMLQSVKEAVMDILNLTPEELEKLLAKQGLELVDLLQTENLQQLVLADSKETNILAVLTDENLAGTMNQLLQAVEDIKADAKLGLSMEQIRNLLEGSKSQQMATTPTNKEANTLAALNSEPVHNQTVNTNAANEEDLTNSTNNNEQKSVQVEVTKLMVENETSSDQQSDLGKNQNQDIKAEEQFELFMNNLTKASSNTQVDFNGNLVQVTEIRDIANQIIERIRVTILPEQTSMELQLNPEHLGKVNLSIQSKDGIMTAQFVVQSELSKEAIESQLHTLRETLNQQGIKVEAIEVTVATYSFEQKGNENTDNPTEAKKNRSGNKLSLEDAMSITELSEDTADAQDITGVRGSNIDYSA